MKKNYRLILIAITILFFTVSFRAFSQIPNAGFENWTGGSPDNWQTDNNSVLVPITQTTDTHSGSYAVQGSVVNFNGFGIAPSLVATFAYTGKPASLTGYYKFNTSNGDSLIISVVLYKNGTGIAGGFFSTAVPATSYTQFNANLYYVNSQLTPDSCTITVVIFLANNAQSTTQFKLDDLAFSNTPTAVSTNVNNKPDNFELYNNYPNPFNPTTTISYQIPQQSMVTLRIFNVLGKEVSTLVNQEKPSGTYSVQFNAVNLPSGVYYCSLQAGSFYKVTKMILLK